VSPGESLRACSRFDANVAEPAPNALLSDYTKRQLLAPVLWSAVPAFLEPELGVGVDAYEVGVAWTSRIFQRSRGGF
jgi:hypothetical protein